MAVADRFAQPVAYLMIELRSVFQHSGCRTVRPQNNVERTERIKHMRTGCQQPVGDSKCIQQNAQRFLRSLSGDSDVFIRVGKGWSEAHVAANPLFCHPVS